MAKALKVFSLALLLVVAGSDNASSGVFGRAIWRGATKNIARCLRGSGVRRSALVTLRKDAARDAGTRAVPLPESRSVFRYVTLRRANRELRLGVAPGSHMTSRANSGRALSAPRALQRFGLPETPQVRETLRIGKGLPVRSNKVVGGSPGLGELTSPKRVPGTAIVRVTPLTD